MPTASSTGSTRTTRSARSSGTRRAATAAPGSSGATTRSSPGCPATPRRTSFRKFMSDPYDPQDLTLSLSLDLQRAAVRALGSNKGAVVMLDPRTGEVLALASTPTYDASAVADPATAEATFAGLLDDPAQPLLPRATQGRYVPGSVFKIVTAVAGLGSGAVKPVDDVQAAAAGREDRPAGRRVPDQGRPPPGDRLARARPRRRDRGLVQHLVCADRPRDRRREPRHVRGPHGLRRADPLRPAHRRLAAQRRERPRSRAGSPTTSSWRTPPTARPRPS